MRFGRNYSKEDASEAGGLMGLRPGNNVVRFLEEMESWTKYYEHYNNNSKRYYPCTGERSSCPGCTSEDEREQRASKRYLANALDGQTSQVRLIKVPSSIINSLDRRADKDGTITGRDFEIYREGKGIDTNYDVESGDKDPINIKKYTLLDHQSALMEAFTAMWGAEPEELVERSTVRNPRRRPVDDEDQPAPRRAPRPTRAVHLPAKVVRSQADDDPPSEPPAQETVREQEEVVDEAELRTMSVAQLSEVFERYQVEFPHEMKNTDGDTTEIVDMLLLALEEQDA